MSSANSMISFQKHALINHMGSTPTDLHEIVCNKFPTTYQTRERERENDIESSMHDAPWPHDPQLKTLFHLN